MTPMNHPEQVMDLVFQIEKTNEAYTLEILGPEGVIIPTNDFSVNRDNISFTFSEPEEGVLLDCVFYGTNQQGYKGRCTDSNGKWAQFSMAPPK